MFYLYLHVAFSNFEDKAGKRWDLTGTRSLIMFPVSVGLGGSLSVALNALTPVLMAGGGCNTTVL